MSYHRGQILDRKALNSNTLSITVIFPGCKRWKCNLLHEVAVESRAEEKNSTLASDRQLFFMGPPSWPTDWSVSAAVISADS